MAAPFDRRTNDNPSTYIVQDRKNKKELTRLTLQDQALTASMGGVLPEQSDPTIFHRVLDVGCGTGGWIIEVAKTYPTMSLVGIDISQRMIEYACVQSRIHQVNDRVEFLVMDALCLLDFQAASFDLVNLRFGISFLRTWDWPKLLTELLRVTCPGGVLRVIDTNVVAPSNSPALTQLFEMLQCALYRSGHLFAQETTGIVAHLERLLDQYGYEQIKTKKYALEYKYGIKQWNDYYQNLMLMFQTMRPFIQKWNCANKDYDALYQQALKEMRQSGFRSTWNLLTVWGSKPKSKS